MRIVVDANVLISALIKPGKPIELFFRNDLEVFAPELLIAEVNRNIAIITKKTSLRPAEVHEFFRALIERVTLIPDRRGEG